MEEYSLEEYVEYTRIIQSTDTELSISYVDMMTDLGRYYVSESDDLSDEQSAANDEINKVKNFNIVVYTHVNKPVVGNLMTSFVVNSTDYNVVEINGYGLEDPVSLSSSYALYSINSVDLTLLTEDIEDYDKNSSYPVDIYLTLEVPNKENPEITDYLPLYYRVIFTGKKEEEEEEVDTEDWIIDGGGEGGIMGDDYDEDSSLGYDLAVSIPEYERYVFLNGASFYDLKHAEDDPYIVHTSENTFTLYSMSTCVRLHVEPSCLKDFYITIGVSQNNIRKTMVVHYTPSILSVTGNKYPRLQKMNTPNVSYALLRANPKLTGNVKIVVDSNSNLYLDTFKVSTSLEQKQHRHIALNVNEYYGQTLMTKFKDVSSTDFYKVENKCYNLFTTAQTYDAQYYDMYRYGVKTNDDKIYSENFALLAPLCIKEIIPDFFVIFKVDTNAPDYDERGMSDDEKIKYFISKGTIIKSYDMRKDSPIGQYVRTIYEHSKAYPGDAYISYSSSNYNKFIGISLDRGVVISAYESTFDEENISNQVEMNDFYTKGFERNRIVSRNIINFEFMFNDTSSDLFSIDTYFGMYIRVNEEDRTFCCTGVSYQELSDDDPDSKEPEKRYIYDSSIHTFDTSINLDDSDIYSNFIYGLTTPTEFIKLNKGLYNAPEIEKYALKPYKNILSKPIKKFDANVFKSFITLKLNKPLEVGDHIRIIDVESKYIYDIVTSNLNFFDDEYEVSDTTVTYYKKLYNEYTIQYVSIHIPFRSEIIDEDKIIKTQVNQIYHALSKFETTSFAPYKAEDNNLSIVGYKLNLLFERISAPSGFTDLQKIYLDENEDENNTITFYNGVEADKVILDIESNEWIHSSYTYLYPLYFEVVGNRMAHIMSFIKIPNITSKNLVYLDIDDFSIFDNTLVYYELDKNDDGSTKLVSTLYESFTISTFENYTEDKSEVLKIKLKDIHVKSVPFFGDFNKQILFVKNPQVNNNIFKLFTCYPLNAGICSFFQLKDFDFNVLDNVNYLTQTENDNTIGSGGEFLKKTIFNYPPDVEEETKSPEPISANSDLLYIYELPEAVAIGDYLKDIEDLEGEDYDINDFYIYDYNSEIADVALNAQYYFTDILEPAVGRILYEPFRTIGSGDDAYRLDDMDNPEYDSVFDISMKCSKDFIMHIIGEDKDDSMRLSDVLQDTVIFNNDSNSYTNIAKKFIETCDASLGLEFIGDLNLQKIVDTVQEKYALCHSKNIEEKISEEEYTNIFYNVLLWKKVGKYISGGSIVLNDDELYSITPLRKTSEESIRDYIDEHRQYDDEYETNNEYFKTLFNGNHTSSDISLVSPYVCKWAGVGTDARGETMRIMHDYVDENGKSILSSKDKEKSYFAVGSNTYSNYIGYMHYKAGQDEQTFKKYIPKSLNQLTQNYETNSTLFGISAKENILSGSGSLDDILYNATDFSNKFSVVYNSGEDTIEFISAGVKFRIKTNNSDALHLSEYAGYSAVFVSLPDMNRDYNKQTELIIDETRKEMMVVWYQSVNTFKYGMKYYDSDDLLHTTSYMCKIHYDHDFTDIKCTYNSSTPIALVPDDNGFGQYIDKNSNKLGRKLCKKQGHLWLGSVKIDDEAYTKYNVLVFTGELNYDKPLDDDNIRNSYPYYLNEGYLTVTNPIFWNNYHQFRANNTDIATYSHDYHLSFTAMLVTDNAKFIVNNIGTFASLSTALKNPSVFVKTANERKDFTTFKNLVNIEVIEPIEYLKYEGLSATVTGKKEMMLGYVHPSFAEPVFKDMLVFNYTSTAVTGTGEDTDSLEKIFEKSFDGANISIAGIKTIDQVWHNKFTDEFNYCMVEDSSTEIENDNITPVYKFKTSLDVQKNVSLMNDSWNHKLYKNYKSVEMNGEDYEQYEYVQGYKTGCEMKTFIHSRGINLNGKNGKRIEITSWKNTQISEYLNSVSSSKQYIKLDITDSLIYNILFRPAFAKYWKYLKLSDNTYKINYIKTTILPFININNKTKFMLFKGSQINNSVYFFSELDEDKGTLVNNYKNELKYENGKYYMYVYPEEMTSYYAKMIIDL